MTTEPTPTPAVAGPVELPVRPACWAFAMDFLGDPEAPVVEAYVSGLETEVARLRAELAAERERCTELTDDMLRYAMAAMGTGSPADADKFRGFWSFAIEARNTRA